MPSHEAPAPLMLRAQSVGCRRGGRRIFNDLSFELASGQVLELRGPNGSGKSSLLRLLAGIASAGAGTLHWGEAPIGQDVAYLGHLNGLNADLTAMENLRFHQRLAGGHGAGSLDATLQSWGLAAQADRPVRRLSQGQQRRLALARVGLGSRRLWLLDEPCAGLDEAGEQLFDARLAEHLAGGGLAVVATHQPLRLPADRCRLLLLGAAAPC